MKAVFYIILELSEQPDRVDPKLRALTPHLKCITHLSPLKYRTLFVHIKR